MFYYPRQGGNVFARVCLFLCLSVSNITGKVVDRFGLHFWERSTMGPGTSDYILGVTRTRHHWLKTLAVCLGGGLRSQSAFSSDLFFYKNP